MADRYLITGGAGFLGINLCRYLLTEGHSVRSLDIAPFAYPERSLVDVIDGDIRDAASVERAMMGIDILVHAAAALPLASPHEILSTAIAGTQLLLDSARAHRVKRFIFISSTAVYGVPDHFPLVESDPLQGVGPYGQSKIHAEELCQLARQSGLWTCVLRPKTFVGPERLGAFELLYDWAASGRSFPVLGTGNNRYQLLDVEDLCRAIVLCATADEHLARDTFNVGAERFGTLRESFQAVLDSAGHGRRVVSLPARPAQALLCALEAVHLSPLYRWIYATAPEESCVSIGHIRTRLNFRPRYSNEEALLRNFAWYLAYRRGIGAATGITHRAPWKKGALAVAKYFF